VAVAEGEGGHLGVCFVDPSMRHFYVGQLEDDTSRSQLGLLLCHVDPVEIVHVRVPPHGDAMHVDTRAAIKVDRQSVREGEPYGWYTVLVTALGSWRKPVPCGHQSVSQSVDQ
jgi:hypothetical protein